MDLCNQSCLMANCCLSIHSSCAAKTLTLYITCKLFNQILSHLPCLQAPLTSTIFVTFSGLDLGLGSQGQGKAKPVGFLFSHTFQVNGVKFDVMVNQFKLNILMLFLRCDGESVQVEHPDTIFE